MATVFQVRPILPAALIASCFAVCSLSVGHVVRSAPATCSTTPPLPSPSLERGRRLFTQSCAHCHGDDARGNGEDGDGPDLARLRIGNARIAAVIRKGIPDEMPSFAKKHSAMDVSDLTAYLRSLR